MQISQLIKHKLGAMSVPNRFYVSSIAVFVIGLLLSLIFGISAFNTATTLTSAMIVCGFVAWCIPAARWMASVWGKPFVKVPLVLLHVLALLVSTALSRSVVAETLGLPPQTFDLTVGFLTIALYIPAWMAVAAISLTIFGVSIFVISALKALVFNSLAIIAPALSLISNRFKLRNYIHTYFFHAIGALIAGAYLLNSYGFLTEGYPPWVHASVKIIAVVSDFQSVENYPDAQPGERIHPMENGYLAFARKTDDKRIVIGVRKPNSYVDDYLLPTPIPSATQMMSPIMNNLQ